MPAEHKGGSHGGGVKDPENDGRLKENREAGRTKGTTLGSEARAREHGRAAPETSHSRPHGSSHGGSHESGSRSGGEQRSESSGRGGDSSDLKQREYRDEKGEVHHHTRTYMEQHGKEGGSEKR